MGVREIRSIADSSYSARSLSEFVVLVEMLAKNGQSAIFGLGFISEKSSKIGNRELKLEDRKTSSGWRRKLWLISNDLPKNLNKSMLTLSGYFFTELGTAISS